MTHISAHLLLILAKVLLHHLSERLAKLLIEWLVRRLADRLGVER